VQKKIIEESEVLKTNPQAGYSLKGKFQHLRSLHFSYKGSAYRVVYQVIEDSSIILIRLAATRENIYRKIENMV
jgi:mRNA-degrading endonuclease RelE of RelBE toxin-antitoxin system